MKNVENIFRKIIFRKYILVVRPQHIFLYIHYFWQLRCANALSRRAEQCGDVNKCLNIAQAGS